MNNKRREPSNLLIFWGYFMRRKVIRVTVIATSLRYAFPFYGSSTLYMIDEVNRVSLTIGGKEPSIWCLEWSGNHLMNRREKRDERMIHGVVPSSYPFRTPRRAGPGRRRTGRGWKCNGMSEEDTSMTNEAQTLETNHGNEELQSM